MEEAGRMRFRAEGEEDEDGASEGEFEEQGGDDESPMEDEDWEGVWEEIEGRATDGCPAEVLVESGEEHRKAAVRQVVRELMDLAQGGPDWNVSKQTLVGIAVGDGGEDGILIQAFEDEEKYGRQERLAVWVQKCREEFVAVKNQ